MHISKLTIDDKNIAYKNNLSKVKNPSITIVFLSGFMSDMEATKSKHVEEYCNKESIGFLALDYSGHGSSSGTIVDGCISDWVHEANSVINHCTKTPVIIVGSSMGGWIALLVALKNNRVKGLVSIANGADFTEDLMWKKMTKTQQKTLMEKGSIKYRRRGSTYHVGKKLIQDGRNNLLLKKNIPLNIPVFLLHGFLDNVVPIENSIQLSKKLSTKNVTLILSKDSNHRMSSESDLRLLECSIERLLQQI